MFGLFHKIIRIILKLWNISLSVVYGDLIAYNSYSRFITRFERRFADYIGCKYGLTFCNGTSTIEAAVFALGIKEDDEVLVLSYTFHSSIFPIIAIGAKPIFVDIDETTLTMDTEDLRKKITDKTRCIVVVHLWGNSAEMNKICAIAKEHNLKIIEDCSHAHGTAWKGKKVGSIGDIGCFSLQGKKSISAGEGGIAVTNDRHLYERMSLYGHFGRIKLEGLQNTQYKCLLPVGVGYKRNANPLGICMAIVDLKYIDRINRNKQKVAEKIEKIIDGIEGVSAVRSYPEAQKGGFYNGFPIVIDKKTAEFISVEKLIEQLKYYGISAKKNHYEMYHKFLHLSDLKYRKGILYNTDNHQIKIPENSIVLPATENTFNRVCFLPLNEHISNRQLKLLRKSLQNIINNAYVS